jgi:hypothetical protein
MKIPNSSSSSGKKGYFSRKFSHLSAFADPVREIHEVWYHPVYTLKEVKNVHKNFRQECETFTPGDVFTTLVFF